MKITHIDCFSGPGGICTGFRAAGIDTVLAIEKVDTCAETYIANHREVPVIVKDIREVTEEDIKKHINYEVDIITSGMPCETFSTAGSKSRSFYDERQFLYREAIRIAKITNAKIILFENVPAIQTKTVGKDSRNLIINELYKDLESAGYNFHYSTTLNAADFGVPQFRDRFFVLATKGGMNLQAPIPHNDNHVTVLEAFAGLPPLDPNGAEKAYYVGEDSDYSKLMKNNAFWDLEKKGEGVTYHIPPKHRVGTLERFSLINQGEGLKDLFDKFSQEEIVELQLRKVLPKKWYIQRNLNP